MMSGCGRLSRVGRRNVRGTWRAQLHESNVWKGQQQTGPHWCTGLRDKLSQFMSQQSIAWEAKQQKLKYGKAI